MTKTNGGKATTTYQDEDNSGVPMSDEELKGASCTESYKEACNTYKLSWSSTTSFVTMSKPGSERVSSLENWAGISTGGGGVA